MIVLCIWMVQVCG